MAWIKNLDIAATWADSKGDIGGFARDPEGELGTGVGPVSSPDGQKWFIIVDDTGTVKTTLVT